MRIGQEGFPELVCSQNAAEAKPVTEGERINFSFRSFHSSAMTFARTTLCRATFSRMKYEKHDNDL
jgi:hypothetical protein